MSKGNEPLLVLDAEPTAIVPREETALATVPASDPMTLIATALEKGLSPEAISSLVDLKHKMDDRAARTAYNQALVAFQRESPVVVKRRQADFNGRPAYKFCGIEDVEDQIAAPLSKNGFAYTFPEAVSSAQGMMRVTCRVTHEAGHSESTSTDIPIPTEMRVNATQKGGAAISYGKRYTLCMALGIRIVGEDNDAATHSSPDVQERAMQTISFEEAVKLGELADVVTDGRKRLMTWASRAAGRHLETIDDIPRGLYEQAVGLLQRNKP